MAKKVILNKSFMRVMFVLFALATVLVGQKPRNISGTVLDVSGEKVGGTTVLLLIDDGTESQRIETSKRGAFKFKKVLPGSYSLNIDAGESGNITSPLTESVEPGLVVPMPTFPEGSIVITRELLVPKYRFEFSKFHT